MEIHHIFGPILDQNVYRRHHLPYVPVVFLAQYKYFQTDSGNANFSVSNHLPIVYYNADQPENIALNPQDAGLYYSK